MCFASLEPARAKWTLKLHLWDGFWKLKGDQHWNTNGIHNGVDTRMVFGGGRSEKAVGYVGPGEG
jgi:hypothetical protein